METIESEVNVSIFLGLKKSLKKKLKKNFEKVLPKKNEK